MRDGRVVLAYLGNGRSTNRYHLPFVMQRLDRFEPRHVYERHPGTSKWGYLDGVRYTDDLEAILADPEVDLVAVCTPAMHYDYARQVLLAGKGLLCEKPFTATLAQAEELFGIAEERGLFASAYQNRRFDSDYLTVKSVVESGVLGNVYEISQHYDYWRPDAPAEMTRMFGFTPEMSMVYLHGVHTVDQAVGWLGTPDRVRSDARQLDGPHTFNDYFDIDLYYDGSGSHGLRYTVHSSYRRAVQRPSFEVWGTRGCFVKAGQDRQEADLKRFVMPGAEGFGLDAPEDFGTLVFYDAAGERHEKRVPTVAGDYGRMYDNAYEAIAHGAAQEVAHDQTLAVMRILEEAVSALS